MSHCPVRVSLGRSPRLSIFLVLALVSNLGTWMHAFSEQWVILLLAGPQAARWAGRQSLASGLAMLVFLPFGGTLADRFEPRKVLVLTQAGLMLSALSVGILACQPQGLTLLRLLGFAVFAGLASALSMPAMWGLLRRLAPPDRPQAGDAWFTLQYDLGRMAGPALAALLLPVFGVAGNFVINAATFAGLLGFCCTLGRAPAPAPSGPARSREAGYRELFAWARRDPGLRSTLLLAAAFGWLAWNQLTLLPVYASRYLGFGPGGLASLMTCLGLGALGASLWMIRGFRGDGRRGITACLGLYGLLLVLWGGWPEARLAYGICLLVGPAQALLWLLLNAQAHRLAPRHLAGRTTALFLTLTMGLMPVGTWIAGELAQALGFQGPRWVLAADGLILSWIALRRGRPNCC
jgi:MFS family permease